MDVHQREKRQRETDNNNEGTTSPIISLNVGGKMFHTLTSTLQGLNGGDYFETLISNRFPQLKDTNGNIFIDRNPEIFVFILEYLRCGKLIGINDIDTLRQIHIEADYYQMTQLKAEAESLAIPNYKYIQTPGNQQIYVVIELDGFRKSGNKKEKVSIPLTISIDDYPRANDNVVRVHTYVHANSLLEIKPEPFFTDSIIRSKLNKKEDFDSIKTHMNFDMSVKRIIQALYHTSLNDDDTGAVVQYGAGARWSRRTLFY